ncbi:MAG: hypothetical protein ACU0BB_17640 [Paracoccaceae bacterium]
MAKASNKERIRKIVKSAEAYFDEEVVKVTAPGGEGRDSYRLHFEERDMIATRRPNYRRTHLEAYVLESLGEHCSDLPRVLGVDDDILYQSDVGRRRLNVEIARCKPARQQELAVEAVTTIFRLHSAARKTDLHTMLPHLGSNRSWVRNLVSGVDALQPYSTGISNKFDRSGVGQFIAQPGRQFIKWDCRSGNAAIGADERLRWFDFEFAGLRHGAEDFAWLIGDEAWPLGPEQMEAIVVDAFDPECQHQIEDYMQYLSVYLSLHCVQRFKLIVKEAHKRGWLSKEKVRKYDDAGVHPEFAMHICNVGAYFADRSDLTRPLVENFEGAARSFKDILEGGSDLRFA